MGFVVDVSVEIDPVERIEVIQKLCLEDWAALLLEDVDEVKALRLIELKDVLCCEEMGQAAMLRGRLLQEILEESFLSPWLLDFLGAFLVKG